MNPALFDELQSGLKAQGPDAALDRLEARLREQKDYNDLFYALLMKKRHQLGVVPVPTSPTQDIPAQHHAAYEEAAQAYRPPPTSSRTSDGKPQSATPCRSS